MVDWYGFALAVLLIELTPGPNMAWLVALALGEGKRAALWAVVGITTGLAINGALAAGGTAALLSARPDLIAILHYVGAAVLLVIAVASWRDAGMSHMLEWDDGRGQWRNLIAGFLTNLFNPKALLFFVVVAPRFLDNSEPGLAQAMSLVATSVTIATVIHVALVLLADHAHGWLKQSGRMQSVRRILALGIAAIAAWMVSSA